VRCSFIFTHRPFYPLKLMCRCLRVSRSSYLRWHGGTDRPHAARDAELSREIFTIHEANRGVYGSPRIHQVLKQRGERVSRKRVARLMREAEITAQPERRRVITTDSDHDQPIADNVLNRDFTATAPNQKWVTDITYIPTDEGWLYLSAIVDLFSRKVVGWSMGATMAVDLVLRSLDAALADRKPTAELIHHSDRGSQYASGWYRDRLNASNITISMSRRGNCHDNACAESFWGRLKVELIYRQRFATRDDARQAIFRYIETFYNRTRLHSALGHVSPNEYENAYHAKIARAS
jgi:transposase InsO family protein